MADLFLVCGLAGFCFVLFRVLHFASQESKPQLHHKNTDFVQRIINACSLLSEPYHPPFLWGKSGHIQTILYAKLGRVQPPLPKGKRISLPMPDGATMTFDIFERLAEHPTKGDYTMLICPGIANSSESLYIRTMVDYAQNNGYRVSVLNHLGALKDVPLTSPRIYTYGGTEEYEKMVHYMLEKYPESKFMAVGCSMGANIVTKFLGNDKKNQDHFICALSLCQGYDVNSCMIYQNTDFYDPDENAKYFFERVWPYLLKWEHLRRFYIFMMTLNQIRVMKQHADVLFSEKALKKYDLDLEKIYASTSLHYLDEVYSRRRAGFSNLDDYYTWCSSVNQINNIDIPMLILNAQDDVIVPDTVFDIPYKYAYSHDKALFVVTKHGGHLGFFEGQEKNWIMPQSITWLDKIVLEYSNAVINVTEHDQ